MRLSTINQPPVSTSVWQQELQHAINNPDHLLHLLELPPTHFSPAAHRQFKLRVPHSYLKKIAKRTPEDPLLLQILPVAEELCLDPTFNSDPTGDQIAEKIPGLLQKYAHRALLLVSKTCPLHCRYCFRRHLSFPPPTLPDTLQWLNKQDSLHEVILSGGDPLTLSDDKLTAWITALAGLPDLRRLRIHTRFPSTIPSRITPKLLQGLTQTHLQPILVLHINHPQEINEEVHNALEQLYRAGILLLNQAVLLKGINDNLDILTQLSETLIHHKIFPYYLHQLDQVQGATHFQVTVSQRQLLTEQLRTHLPGYLMPQIVEEVAGSPYKKPLL